MKKNLMKKVFAVTLSVAMACSIIPATNPVTASAAAAVKLKASTSKTLKVGDKSKLTLKNNNKKWKVVKATSSKKKVVKVYKTAKKYAKVKGKSEGKAVITVKVKSAQTKKTKKLKMTFTVKDNTTPTPTPDPTPEPVKTEATVKTQEELDAALADSNITKITIATEEEAKFVIKEGTYSSVDLIVNAPKADVENNAVFRNITIQAIKGETWTENAKGNVLKVLAKLASIIVGKDASLSSIEFATADADVKLIVNGEVQNATVSAKIKLDIKGESKKPIKVKVATSAKDTQVDSAVPVAVETSADLKLNLSEGAEGSSLEFAAADINVELDNQTKEAVEVTKFDKTKDKVDAGRKKTVTSPSKNTNVPNPVNPGNPVNPINKVPSKETLITSDIKINTGASVTIVSGGANVISEGSLFFEVVGIKNTSGSAMECSAVIKSGGMTRYVSPIPFDVSPSKYEDGKVVEYEGGVAFNVSPLYLANGSFDITLTIKARETASTLAGASKIVDNLKISLPSGFNVEGYGKQIYTMLEGGSTLELTHVYDKDGKLIKEWNTSTKKLEDKK